MRSTGSSRTSALRRSPSETHKKTRSGKRARLAMVSSPRNRNLTGRSLLKKRSARKLRDQSS